MVAYRRDVAVAQGDHAVQGVRCRALQQHAETVQLWAGKRGGRAESTGRKRLIVKTFPFRGGAAGFLLQLIFFFSSSASFGVKICVLRC